MSSWSCPPPSPRTPRPQPRPPSSMGDGGPFGPASVIVFGLFAAITWGAGDFGGGLVSRRITVVVLVLATQLVGMVAALLLAVLRAEPVPAPVDIGWSAISGVLGAVGIMALY